MDNKKLLESTRSLESKISEDFHGKRVKVWIQWCPWYVGMIEVWAKVESVSAYVTLDPDFPPNEWYLHDILVGNIKELMDD